jgi:hypothetical protein
MIFLPLLSYVSPLEPSHSSLALTSLSPSCLNMLLSSRYEDLEKIEGDNLDKIQGPKIQIYVYNVYRCSLGKPNPLVVTEKTYIQNISKDCSRNIPDMMKVVKIKKYLFYEVKRTKTHELEFSIKTRTSGLPNQNIRFRRIPLGHESDRFVQYFEDILQVEIVGHIGRQCTKENLNLPMVLRDQRSRPKVLLERGDPKMKEELKSPILGDANPPKNRRTSRLRVEITKTGEWELSMVVLGGLDENENEDEGQHFSSCRVKTDKAALFED